MTIKSKSPQQTKGKTAESPPSKPTKVKAPALNSRRDALRKMLLDRRQEVLKEIEELIGKRLSDDAQNRVDSVPDVGDQALLDSERGRDISILEMRNRTRQNIDEALIRLDEGAYGICSDCGVEISEKRLKAIPFARRCVSCQAKEELLEKIEREEDQSS
jgi:RNA polymerase-binding transcription factor